MTDVEICHFHVAQLLQQNFAVLVFHEFGSTSGFQKYPHVRISQLEAAV
jgi:hypothetical protein